MAEKDKIEKILEDYNDVFADIFNVLVFKNKAIDEHFLQESTTESFYKSAEGNYRNQFRDIGKYYIGLDKKQVPFSIAELGIENQSGFDKFMAFRIMGYDYGSYRKQLDKKPSTVYPSISIVLNFSNDMYPDRMGLKEYMDTPAVISSLSDYSECGDYKVRCYNIAYLEDEVIESFTSDFKSVAYFFKGKRLYGDEFIPNRDEIKHVEAFLDLLSVFTNDNEYNEIVDGLINKQKEGQVITMCEIKEAWKMSGIDALIYLISEIKNGAQDKQLAEKGYSSDLIKRAHDAIQVATSATK